MATDDIFEEDFPELDDIISNVPKETDIFVSHALSISEYISRALQSLPQKKLAEDLNKTEAEISKWLSGSHNFTLRTISKIESVLPIHIINPIIRSFFENKLSATTISSNSISISRITSDYYCHLFIGKLNTGSGGYHPIKIDDRKGLTIQLDHVV